MSAPPLDDAAVLAALRGADRRALHVAEIATALGLALPDRRRLSAALAGLVERGMVHAIAGSRFRLPRSVDGPRVVGRFTAHPRGFGFVSASDGGSDVYVRATSMLGAMHGDLVAATVSQGPRGREGVVLEVITRRSEKVPGTLRVRAKSAFVEPDDDRVRGPIQVGDLAGATDGQSVVARIESWPEHADERASGRVVEVLAGVGELATEVRKVLLREGVEEAFPSDATAEAEALPTTVLAQELQGREDLRGLDLVTIDPDDARDHDDAIHVALRDDGSWVATVAIADVGHYVRPGTALDRAAITRGLSVYLPDRAVPMLPRALSSHLASLVEGEDRLVLGVEASISPQGTVTSSRFFEGVMRSRGRLTYSRVARALGWIEGAEDGGVDVGLLPMLEGAAALAAILRGRRLGRGALDFDLPEGRVRFADDGVTPEDIVQSRGDPGVRKAYQLVEEMMLLANEAVARRLVEDDVPTVFRVHGEPDDDHILKLCAVARALGHRIEPDDARKPKRLSAFLRRIQATPESRVLGMIALRAMPQARYSSVNTGHFGLASSAYLHFTSPIRRYPDIVAHRGLRALLQGDASVRSDERRSANLRAAADCSRLERSTMEVERDVLDLYRCEVARPLVNESFTGTVSNVTPAGVWVEIERPFLTGLLRVETLGPDFWEVDELGLTLRGARTGRVFRLGESLVVEISEVSMARRSVFLRLPKGTQKAVGELPQHRAKKGPGKGRGRGSRR